MRLKLRFSAPAVIAFMLLTAMMASQIYCYISISDSILDESVRAVKYYENKDLATTDYQNNLDVVRVMAMRMRKTIYNAWPTYIAMSGILYLTSTAVLFVRPVECRNKNSNS
jgi:hypothetical protein